MTEQGFKRFRRRGVNRSPELGKGERPMLPDKDGFIRGEEDVPPASVTNLPARIGDEWPFLPAQPTVGGPVRGGDRPLVNLCRDDPAARAFDLLRTRLLQALRDNGWSRVAIAAPLPGCGATFTAVNLALSLARIPDSRTVLMDLNLRTPGVAGALGARVPANGDMRRFLGGEVPVREQFIRVGETLALGLAAASDKDAAEHLHDGRTAKSLGRMFSALRPDVVLYDLPPVLVHDDAAAFLPHVDGVLLVADGESTTAADIKACERVFAGRTRLFGVVLNRARRRTRDRVEC